MTEHDYAQIVAKLAAAEQEHESFKRRLNTLEEASKEHGTIMKEIWQLSAAIKSILESQQRTEKDIRSMNARVAALEAEPGQKWKKVSMEVIVGIVAAVVGIVIGNLIGG
jgi:septal ring factor EnvC (AmiA/AmiB activator)